VLSTRIDLVGPDVARELKVLQTDCPADSPEDVRRTVEQDLGRPVAVAFP
jgi:ubiquinone biosynthesis protein